MALMKRSAGKWERSRGARHQVRAPIVPKLLNALLQNGAGIPNVAVKAPPRAGPTARLMLAPTLLIAIAEGKSCRGTSCETTDCQVGDVAAEPASIRKTNTSSIAVGTSLTDTNTAKAREAAAR